MPVSGNTDPSALLMQRMGPAASPGGGGLPPPGQSPTGEASGGSQPPEMTPQMLMLAQLAQRLLTQQKGTEYIQKFLRQIAMMVKSAMSSEFMQHPKAESDLGGAMQKLNSAIEHISKATPESGGTIQSSLMQMLKPANAMDGEPQPPGGQQQPGPPSYPLANAA